MGSVGSKPAAARRSSRHPSGAHYPASLVKLTDSSSATGCSQPGGDGRVAGGGRGWQGGGGEGRNFLTRDSHTPVCFIPVDIGEKPSGLLCRISIRQLPMQIYANWGQLFVGSRALRQATVGLFSFILNCLIPFSFLISFLHRGREKSVIAFSLSVDVARC